MPPDQIQHSIEKALHLSHFARRLAESDADLKKTAAATFEAWNKEMEAIPTNTS